MSEWIEFTGKTVDDAFTEALIKLETTSDKVTFEVIEKESNGILGLFAKKDARIRVKLNNDITDTIREFLEKVFKAMEIDATINIDYNKEESLMNIDLVGEDMGIIIGKRGQTLDSLQYLTSLVANKNSDKYVKIKIDTENYRQRRKETIENLAKNMANKVKKTGRPAFLEPMNPYERRIIHAALQPDKYVDTHSEGDEPHRKVVITLNREFASELPRRNNYRKKNNYSRDRRKPYANREQKRD